MDLGRPIARHFARRPHESDDPAVSAATEDSGRAHTPPARDERLDLPAEAASEPEPDTPRTGRPRF